MSKKNNPVTLDPFQAWCHRWGRAGTVIALIYMVALPLIVLSVYDSVPPIGQVFNLTTFGLLIIYIAVGISEALSYIPIMGASSYLGFITGNIMNLKVPVAINAIKTANQEPSTPAGDCVAAIGIAVSSIVTVVILAITAALSSQLSFLYDVPAFRTASNYLIPALFGSMTLGLFASTSSGSKVVKNGIMGVVPVIIIVSIITLAARIMGGAAASAQIMGLVGPIIMVMLPIAILSSWIMYKKGIIKVVDNDKKDS